MNRRLTVFVHVVCTYHMYIHAESKSMTSIYDINVVHVSFSPSARYYASPFIVCQLNGCLWAHIFESTLKLQKLRHHQRQQHSSQPATNTSYTHRIFSVFTLPCHFHAVSVCFFSSLTEGMDNSFQHIYAKHARITPIRFNAVPFQSNLPAVPRSFQLWWFFFLPACSRTQFVL